MESPFNYPGPTTDLDALATNRLIPGEGAKTFGVVTTVLGEEIPKRAEWIETVQVNDITFGAPERPLNNQKSGDVVGLLVVKCSVDPAGGASKNLGRRIGARYYFNMTALERPGDGHGIMTRSSFGGVYALVKALGLPSDAAKDPGNLAEEYRPEIVGRRMLAVVEQRYDEEKDRYYDSVKSFASTGE